MSLDLNKLATKLDEALSLENSETLNKFLTDKKMSKNKQSSVELLRCKMIALTLLKLNQSDREMMEHFFEQAKAMHKEEIKQVWIDAYTANMKAPTRNNFILWAEQYYNETFKSE